MSNTIQSFAPTLIFHTPTTFDIQYATVFGLSKKTNANPIGKFGTGLKYAIAGVLRLGGSFLVVERTNGTIVKQCEFYSGEAGRVIIVERLRIDEPEYSAPYTTALGSHWTPAMLYRELLANTMDEGGWIALLKNPDLLNEKCKDGTTIYVQCEPLIDVHQNPFSVLLQTDELPIYSSPTLQVFPVPSSYIYANGIVVCKRPAELTYSYNILNNDLPLTEDRTIDSTWCQNYIIAELMSEKNEILSKIAKKNSQENFQWNWNCIFNMVEPNPWLEEFANTCDLTNINSTIIQYIDKRYSYINEKITYKLNALPEGKELAATFKQVSDLILSNSIIDPGTMPQSISFANLTYSWEDFSLNNNTLLVNSELLPNTNFSSREFAHKMFLYLMHNAVNLDQFLFQQYFEAYKQIFKD